MGTDARRLMDALNGATVPETADSGSPSRIRFDVFGEQLIQKTVKPCGEIGRTCLPPDWVDERVKIIRVG
jgi:hypothetical protein